MRKQCKRPSIDKRFSTWAKHNPRVLRTLLAMARRKVRAGAKRVSVKALWEQARSKLRVQRTGRYKLNNDYTAPAARWLIAKEPRLIGAIEMRRRRS
ncbi:MAG: hypothetical protein ACTHU0_19275 [Kofleriaceae bacterium]